MTNDRNGNTSAAAVRYPSFSCFRTIRFPLVPMTIATVALVVLGGCRTPGDYMPTTQRDTGRPSDRVTQDIFETAAVKLLETIDDGTRVAIRPVCNNDSVVPSGVCMRIEENLVSALHAKSDNQITILTRTELGKLIEDIDPFDLQAIKDVQERTKADALVITNLHAVTGGLTLSFVAYDLRPDNLGGVLAATSGHFLQIDLEKAERATAVVATRKAAHALANKILEDSTLMASRLRFEASSKGQGSLDAWLSANLVKQLDEVLPEVRKARWAPILGETTPTRHLPVDTETWDQGSQVQVRFRVRDKNGATLAEQVEHIASSSIPFGVLDERTTREPKTAALETKTRSLALAFEKSRSTLSPSIRSKLVQLAQRYAENKGIRFRIDSHAAYHGGTQDPSMTAQLRASAIQAVLLRGGIDSQRIQTRTYPHSSPSPDSDTAVVTYGLSMN